MSVPATAPPDAVQAFTRQYDRLRHTRAAHTALGLGVFAALFVGAAVVGNFNPATLVEGAPKLGDYILRTVPLLRRDSLFED
ncbi:MAG: hypothetical protein GEU76_16820, partial [Alphaproteobacteria bacterium]|nr:hypothetical protein [Alphaproteobacteria bacterium]